MANKKMNNKNKNANDTKLTDTEDKMVQDAVKDIAVLWAEHNASIEKAAHIKIKIGGYIFGKFFGNNESKLYDAEDKYHPRKVNSYAALLASDEFKKLDITPQTLRAMVYCAVTVKSLNDQGVDIMKWIEDEATIWTYTHLKFLARLERNHKAQLDLVNEVNEENLSSRELEEKVKFLLPRNPGEPSAPEDYEEVLLKAPTLMSPVMELRKDIKRLLTYNPTDENTDSENYVDGPQRKNIHAAIKTTIENFNKAIKSLKALEEEIKKQESKSQNEETETTNQKAA
jgi:hypothetical protein